MEAWVCLMSRTLRRRQLPVDPHSGHPMSAGPQHPCRALIGDSPVTQTSTSASGSPLRGRPTTTERLALRGVDIAGALPSTAASTVWKILRDNGRQPTSNRTGPTWSQFVQSQAPALVATDFFCVGTVTLCRLQAARNRTVVHRKAIRFVIRDGADASVIELGRPVPHTTICAGLINEYRPAA